MDIEYASFQLMTKFSVYSGSLLDFLTDFL